MKKLLLLNVLLVSFINLSCKCGWGGNFLRVAPHSTLLVKAKVLSFSKVHSDLEEKMTVEILTVFKGKESRKKITVWGDNGMLCRPYISTFKKNTIYYLALKPEGKDYEISVCGEYWLKIENDQIQMQKNEEDAEKPKAMLIQEFEKLLRAEIKK